MASYLRVNFLGPGPSLIIKKNLPGRGLTKVEKHWSALTRLDNSKMLPISYALHGSS